MKNLMFLILMVVCFVQPIIAQNWGGFPISKVADNSVLIFEGRILTDSVFFQNPPGVVSTIHKVLVLKQFKGDFKSDTLIVVNIRGAMSLNGMLQGDYPAYAHKNDEAIFMVNNYWGHNFYFIGYGNGCGFVKICDKKDVVKEVYEPIEAVTGQPYIDVHPNTCATQQKK